MTFLSDLKLHMVVILTILIVISMVAPYGKSAIALALLPLALMSRDKALFALIALFLVKMSNTAITGVDQHAASAAWLTSLVASTRLWFDFVVQGRYMSASQLKPLMLFAIVALGLSAFSLSPMVSLLKAFVFLYIVGAILVGVTSQRPGKTTILSWLYASWFSILIISIPILTIPEIGYFRDNQGFQGALNHPQAMVIFIAPLTSWLWAKSLGTKRINPGLVAVLILAICIIVLTRGRTGIVSIIMGAIFLGFFRSGSIISWIKWLKRSQASLIIFPLAILFLPIVFTQFKGEIQEFVFKSSSSASLGTAFEESRGFLMDQSVNNFKSHPMTGIGFGVSNSDTHELNVEIDPVTGLPLSAPTEKANIVIAVLEETGIIGIIAFSIFFVPFLRAIANSENVALAWAALTAVCTNISEVTFFSMGGFGTYIWIICAIALSLSPSKGRH